MTFLKNCDGALVESVNNRLQPVLSRYFLRELRSHKVI
jgi:hypothetical protein